MSHETIHRFRISCVQREGHRSCSSETARLRRANGSDFASERQGTKGSSQNPPSTPFGSEFTQRPARCRRLIAVIRTRLVHLTEEGHLHLLRLLGVYLGRRTGIPNAWAFPSSLGAAFRPEECRDSRLPSLPSLPQRLNKVAHLVVGYRLTR